MEAEIGLRELRQNASELIRRVEAGEGLIVTVSGRAAARIVPVGGRSWRRWDEVADVLSAPGVPGLMGDLAGFDDAIADPFEQADRRR